MRARFYNPVVGRFTQEDEYRADGLNLYAYVANNPVNYIDPSGYARGAVLSPCEMKGDISNRGNRPNPSERSMTKEQWKRDMSDRRRDVRDKEARYRQSPKADKIINKKAYKDAVKDLNEYKRNVGNGFKYKDRNRVTNPITKNIGGNNIIAIDEYGKLRYNSTPGQAHHLNQNAAYSGIIPQEVGISVKLKGNAFVQPGTQHYKAHISIESFWDQFRRGGSQYQRRTPTNLEYTKAVYNSMREAGYNKNDAMFITRQAIKQRVEFGQLGGKEVPNLPGRINQTR